MAEEAIGLAKSLGWQVAHWEEDSNKSSILQDTENYLHAVEEIQRNRKHTPMIYSTHTIEGEPLHDGDYVHVPFTGLKGHYMV